MTPRSVPIVDRMTDAFFALDTDFRFTYLNDRAESLLTRSSGSLLGRVMWDEFPGTLETEFPVAFHKAIDESVPVYFDVYHNPLETWFEVRVYPAEDGLSVLMYDVTDRKESEELLAKHAAVVEAIHEGVVTLDRSNRITSTNESIEETVNVAPEELVGEHVERLLELARVEPADAVSIGRALTDVAVGNVSFRSLEIPFVAADGTDRIGELKIVPIEHETASIAGIVRDVTDQREYERVITSMHQLTRWLLQTDDPDEICAIAVHTGSDLLDLPICGIWILDDEHGYLEPIAATADAHDEFGGLPRFYTGDGLVWDAFEDGSLRYYEDLRTVDGVYNPETSIRSEIIAPIGTYGVLMTGSHTPDRFDATDQELLSVLVENTRAALDRADKERVLRERTTQLERQTDRLEAIATVLSTDFKTCLESIATVVDSENEVPSNEPPEWDFPLANETVESTVTRIDRLVDDVKEFAQTATAIGTRRRLCLATAIEDGVDTSTLDDATVVVEADATLRADPDRFERLLETLFDTIAERAADDVTIRVGLLGLEEPTNGSRGFFLMDDAPSPPVALPEQPLAESESELLPSQTEPFDGLVPIEKSHRLDGTVDATDETIDGWNSDERSNTPVDDRTSSVDDRTSSVGSTPTTSLSSDGFGLRLALVRAIADAHDWSVSIYSDDSGGTTTEIRDVTTLERQPNRTEMRE